MELGGAGRNAEFVKITYTPNVHSDTILGVRYLAANKTVITISRDPQASLLIRQVDNKFESYIFRLSWGVRCFDYKYVDSIIFFVCVGSFLFVCLK